MFLEVLVFLLSLHLVLMIVFKLSWVVDVVTFFQWFRHVDGHSTILIFPDVADPRGAMWLLVHHLAIQNNHQCSSEILFKESI